MRVCCRREFDDDRVPMLTDDIYVRDIHSISSLLKMYFRELPNPLLTYQLYDKFVVGSVNKLDLNIIVFKKRLQPVGALCNKLTYLTVCLIK